jgi:hypothetical protein
MWKWRNRSGEIGADNTYKCDEIVDFRPIAKLGDCRTHFEQLYVTDLDPPFSLSWNRTIQLELLPKFAPTAKRLRFIDKTR